MVLWWIGNLILLLVVVPVLVALLNRVLAALERDPRRPPTTSWPAASRSSASWTAYPRRWPRPTRPSRTSPSARSATPARSRKLLG